MKRREGGEEGWRERRADLEAVCFRFVWSGVCGMRTVRTSVASAFSCAADTVDGRPLMNSTRPASRSAHIQTDTHFLDGELGSHVLQI